MEQLEFTSISFEDKEDILSLYHRHNICDSDLEFVNLICWERIYPSSVARKDGMTVLRFVLDDGSVAYLPPLGEGDRSSLFPLIEDDAKSRGDTLRFCAYDSDDIALIRKSFPDFGFYFLRSRSDYIFLRGEITALHGKKYDMKRNQINKIRAKYRYEYAPLREEDLQECRLLLEEWKEERISKDDLSVHYVREIDNESASIDIAFSNFARLGLIGSVIRIDGRIAAFGYGSASAPDMFDYQIHKADYRYNGLFSVLDHELFSHLPECFSYINMECDMGLQGLRQYKESYHPAYLLTKYTGERMDKLRLEVRKLWLECFEEDDALDAEQFLMTRFKPENMLSIRADGKLVSMLHIIPFGDTAYIYACATSPGYRLNGHLRTLMQNALEECRRKGYTSAVLIPSGEEIASIYGKMGFSGRYPVVFHTVDEYDFGTGDKTRDLAMLHPLSADFTMPEPGTEVRLYEI